MDMVLLDGPELLEGLPPSPRSRSPFPCFIHSLGLTVSLFRPFQSFLNRRDLRFLSDMKNALGIWDRKQVDRIVLQVTESELTHNLFLGQTIFFLILQALWDLKAGKLPPIGFQSILIKESISPTLSPSPTPNIHTNLLFLFYFVAPNSFALVI